MATTLDHGIEFTPQWQQRDSSVNDSFTISLTEMGTLAPDRPGDEFGVPSLGLEQDISSVRLSEDSKNVGGGVPDHLAIPVRFGERQNTEGRGTAP
ncbi:hypothetical protein BS47DRAFT_1337174 [Hydnum rufescens UP504]|uniref:Uncharacterized protein n=1 Tax=Hydnum rufescens UP504 TaxID=1448309 RepID=A0A9P6B7W9_9AGAM|nr:hypothetical protein BS47DRAFT_1337174 [Hydnum rufescens UP504]